jgi:hypothetical protein
MNPICFKYICATCGNQFTAPGMPDGAYGEFVLRSQASDLCAYMSAFDDGVLNELGVILNQNAVKWGVAEAQIPDLQQKLFSITTDRGEDGAHFEIGLAPKCPKCNSCNPASWIEEEPVRKIDLKPVAHNDWAKLDRKAKERMVKTALDNRL